MQYDKVTEYKETLSSSVPIVETIPVKEHKDVSKVCKSPCVCGETKHISFTMCIDGVTRPLCRKCREPTVLNITARSMISQADDELLLSNMKVLNVLEEISSIIGEHFVCLVSTHSTALQNKVTKSKTVDMYKKFGMKITKREPTVTLL